MILCYEKSIHELMTIAYVELYSSRVARTNYEQMSMPLVLGLVAPTMISGYPPALYAIGVLPYHSERHIYFILVTVTYDHRSVKTGHPVRSAIHKH